MVADFEWQDGERTIRFGRGTVDSVPELLGDGYVLLTTPRAATQAPVVTERAASVHHVAPGLVDELAATLLDELPDAPLLVALGGRKLAPALVMREVGAQRSQAGDLPVQFARPGLPGDQA